MACLVDHQLFQKSLNWRSLSYHSWWANVDVVSEEGGHWPFSKRIVNLPSALKYWRMTVMSENPRKYFVCTTLLWPPVKLSSVEKLLHWTLHNTAQPANLNIKTYIVSSDRSSYSDCVAVAVPLLFLLFLLLLLDPWLEPLVEALQASWLTLSWLADQISKKLNWYVNFTLWNSKVPSKLSSLVTKVVWACFPGKKLLRKLVRGLSRRYSPRRWSHMYHMGAARQI